MPREYHERRESHIINLPVGELLYQVEFENLIESETIYSGRDTSPCNEVLKDEIEIIDVQLVADGDVHECDWPETIEAELRKVEAGWREMSIYELDE